MVETPRALLSSSQVLVNTGGVAALSITSTAGTAAKAVTGRVVLPAAPGTWHQAVADTAVHLAKNAPGHPVENIRGHLPGMVSC